MMNLSATSQEVGVSLNMAGFMHRSREKAREMSRRVFSSDHL